MKKQEKQEKYKSFVVDYLDTRFIPAMAVWVSAVVETLELFDTRKYRISADINYEFVKRKLEQHIESYLLLVEETYEAIYKKAEELDIDLDAQDLIPISIWLGCKNRVENKLDKLFNDIESSLKKYAAIIENSPEDVQEIVKDITAILKINADQIWRLLNSVLRGDSL